jgi:hypothetical protein
MYFPLNNEADEHNPNLCSYNMINFVAGQGGVITDGSRDFQMPVNEAFRQWVLVLHTSL